MVDAAMYTVGGTVQVNERGIYLARQADDELLRLCQEGEFAYVLTPRQMGKSSLMTHTAECLFAVGTKVVILDLTKIGTQSSAAEWYRGLLDVVAMQLELAIDVAAWWEAHGHVGVTQRLTQFFETVVLPEVTGKIVIFIDEIDTTLSLPFTDDFFAAVRFLYLARAMQPELRRLSFVLIGVATPGNLIQDAKRTPFNVGTRVDLQGFQLAEALPLAPGLAAKVADAQVALAAILDWTGGQPFLTQKLCRLMVLGESVAPGQEVAAVEERVRSRILNNWESQDDPEHLKTIRTRLLEGDEQMQGLLLGLYQQILLAGTATDATDATDQTAPEQMTLLLSGLVVKRGNRLQVHNRIYEAVFSREWVAEELAKLRSYGAALQIWLRSDRTDESRLLRGQALQEALTWARNKRLDDVDRQFFEASQAIELRETEQQRQAEAEARQALEVANRKARRRIKVGSGVLVGTLVLSAIAVLGTNRVATQAQRAAVQAQRAAVQAQQDAAQVTEKAERDRQEAKRAVDSAEQKTKQSELAAEQAKNAEKTAKQEVGKARVEQAKILQQSQQQIALAQQKEGEARSRVSAAQQRVSAAQQRENEANAAAEKAQGEVKEADGFAKRATELERESMTLLRLPSDNFWQLETLVVALEQGYRLKKLMQQMRQLPQIRQGKSDRFSMQGYPALSPMLALRTATNFVSQRAILRGDKASFNATGDRILVSSFENSNPYLYDSNGLNPIELKGLFASFNATGDRILVKSFPDTRIYVYDKNGQNPVEFQGGNAQFNATGDRILVSSSENLSYVYDKNGQNPVELKGWNAYFNATGDRILTSSSENLNYVYDKNGQNPVELKGWNAHFNETGDRILTSTDDLITVYDSNGKKLVEFQGWNARFSEKGDRILVDSWSAPDNPDNVVEIYDRNGQNPIKLQKGHNNIRFNPQGNQILVDVRSSSGELSSYVYDSNGYSVALQGRDARFNAKGDRILVDASSGNSSYLYDSNGKNPVELKGFNARFSVKGDYRRSA
jgi:hypothetical protein